MKRALLLLLLFGCTPDEVRYVIDGDTLMLNNGTTVRLLNIDAPEFGDIYYDRAAYELQRRLHGQIILENEGTDHYGRQLSHVFANGEHVNLELVREGWARMFMNKDKYAAVFEKAQEEAQSERKGIWNVNEDSYKRLAGNCENFGCPIGTIAVGSNEGDVYYNCACGAAYQITNVKCFLTIQEAIADGRREARKC